MVVGDLRRRKKRCAATQTVFSQALGKKVKRCKKWEWL